MRRRGIADSANWYVCTNRSWFGAATLAPNGSGGRSRQPTGALVMYRSIVFSAAAVALMVGSVSAQASCGAPANGKAGVVSKFPNLKLSRMEVAPQGAASIVGLWKNSVIVGGNVVVNSIAAWHSDGTEFDNVDFPPT